mgnify:CR=1 FL=1
MAAIDKTIDALLRSIGIKLKPGLATNIKRLEGIDTSFNLDFTKFGKMADPQKLKKLIETDANFVFRVPEGEKQQFVNNVNYLKATYPDLFKESSLTSSKTGEKLIASIDKPLENLTETEISLGVTTPEHRRLLKDYLDAKKEHLEFIEKNKRDFNKMYKEGDIPMSSESRWALEDELKKKGLTDEQLYDLFHNAEKDTWYWDYTKNRGAFRPMPPEEFYKNVQDELKKTYNIDHNMDFYINLANSLKKPEFASGGRVGYDAGGAIVKAAMKALEKAKQLRMQAKQSLKEGDWMSASTYDKQAQRIETGYYFNKDPKDVTFEDILNHHKATYPDTPERYAGIEGEHWVDRARNLYKQMKERWAAEGEPDIFEQLKIKAKPKDRNYDFAVGGPVLTPKSVANLFGKTAEKGIGSMFKKKKR